VSNSAVNVTINGLHVVSILDFQHRKNKPTNLGPELVFGGWGCNLGFESFIGYLTEVYAWDRPLGYQEINNYSVGCDTNFVLESNPTAIKWTQLKVTHRGNNTSEFFIEREELCASNDVSNTKTNRIMSYKLEFEEANTLCTLLGGQMPVPSTINSTVSILQNYKWNKARVCNYSSLDY
jgi:hypothetical protein